MRVADLTGRLASTSASALDLLLDRNLAQFAGNSTVDVTPFKESGSGTYSGL